MIPKIKLSKHGPEISRLALGFKDFAERDLSLKQRLHWLEQCFDLGYTTIDLADVYSSYRSVTAFGDLLKKQPELRERIQIICKYDTKEKHRQRPQTFVRHYDTSLMHLVSSVDHSLMELNTDHLDVLLLHNPDPLMNPSEVAEAFSQLKDSGKVGCFGLSNFLPRQIELLSHVVGEPLVTNQFEFSLASLAPLHNGVLDKCQILGMVPMAWGPLAQGRLFNPKDERFYRIIVVLNSVKKECAAKSKAAIALAWLLRHPANIVPVLGTSQIKHLKQAAASVDIELTREQWFLLLAASIGRDVA